MKSSPPRRPNPDIIEADGFIEDSSVVIDDLSREYIVDEEDRTYVYIPFYATNIYSVEIQPKSFYSYKTNDVVKLTSQDNIDNLYAVRFTLDKENAADRTSHFTITVRSTEMTIAGLSSITIVQKGCQQEEE